MEPKPEPSQSDNLERLNLKKLATEDAGHRDWRNVRKNNLQNMAKEPEKPTTNEDNVWFHKDCNLGRDIVTLFAVLSVTL